MIDRGVRIVLSQQWAVLRRGLVAVMQGPHLVVADVASVAELRGVVRKRPVDLAIVGAEPNVDLASAVRELSLTAGAPPVIALVDGIGLELLRDLLQAGAQGVLTTHVEDSTLLDAVGRVVDGDRVIDQVYLPLLFGDLDPASETSSDGLLTPREREVLEFLARGYTNRQIAEALVVGEATVKTHLGRIYAKLEVDGRHHAVGRALELGMLDLALLLNHVDGLPIRGLERTWT